MYTDREMTLDVLEIAKAGAVSFTQAATETSSPAIRQALIQMRSQCEQAQQMLGQYAQSKNFYKPAPAAPSQDVSEINQFLQQSVAQSQML